MSWFTSRNQTQHYAESALRLLARFGLSATRDGEIRIRPAGPVLGYDDLDLILTRLEEEEVHLHAGEIVIDFGLVELIEVPWTAGIARLVDFARRSRAACRLDALHGQPAAVVEFFRGERAVQTLLEVRPLHTLPPTSKTGRASA